MSNRARKNALLKLMEAHLDTWGEWESRMLLEQYIKVFEAKQYYDKEKNWMKRLWYGVFMLKVGIPGLVNDVRMNQVVARQLFPASYYKFGTFTATLWRVKEAKEYPAFGGYHHPKYGFLSVEQMMIRDQICAVLNQYDKDGHC